MQDRGLAAYIAELLGTFFLVFGITLVGVLFIAVGDNASFGSDFAVVGLTYAFILTALIFAFGGASGGHFNPAITVGAALMKKIAPVDAVIYILAQLSGGVLGALLTKGLLAALNAKDFAKADEIRAALLAEGIQLMDSKNDAGERVTTWEIKR